MSRRRTTKARREIGRGFKMLDGVTRGDLTEKVIFE